MGYVLITRVIKSHKLLEKLHEIYSLTENIHFTFLFSVSYYNYKHSVVILTPNTLPAILSLIEVNFTTTFDLPLVNSLGIL